MRCCVRRWLVVAVACIQPVFEPVFDLFGRAQKRMPEIDGVKTHGSIVHEEEEAAGQPVQEGYTKLWGFHLHPTMIANTRKDCLYAGRQPRRFSVVLDHRRVS